MFFLEQQELYFYSIFIPYLEKNNIKDVWILGDFFEHRKVLSIFTLNKAVKFLKTLQDKNINTIMILGNHDVVYRNTNEFNSISPIFKSFSNIKIIDKFEVIKFDDINIGFISWINQDIRSECIDWIKTNNASILCGHFEINSFEIVKGVVCNNGLNQDLFEKYDKVFSGHFHIRANNGIIYYIGNPYQTNWGEYGFEKGFAVFNTIDKSVEFIENPTKIYETIVYNEQIDFLKFDFKYYTNKIVRIYSDPRKEKNKKTLELFIEKLSSYVYSLELIEDKDVIVNNEDEDKELYQTADTIQLINQFLTSCEINNLDKKQLQESIFEIYREAIEKGINEC